MSIELVDIFLYWVVWVGVYSYTSSLSEICIINIVFQSIACIFFSLRRFSHDQRLLILMKFILYFSFMVSVLVSLWNLGLCQDFKISSFVFLLKLSFFIIVCENDPFLIIFYNMVMCYSRNISWRDFLFLHWVSLAAVSGLYTHLFVLKSPANKHPLDDCNFRKCSNR